MLVFPRFAMPAKTLCREYLRELINNKDYFCNLGIR